MRTRIRIAVVAPAIAGLLFAAVGPAGSAESRAAINGSARASAAFVPFAVNPNFDFWPVFSFSETNSNLSHGLSAGFWPGFLVDATFFQFGYQPFERAFFGVSESLYPGTPEEDDASTGDFQELCAAGAVSTVPLPFGYGDAGFPEPMLTGCQTMWAQYNHFLPYEHSASSTQSAPRMSEGSARGQSVRVGVVTIGQARVTSGTDGASGKAVDSSASVLLRDVRIGETLRVKEMRSTANAVADGTAKGMTATHGFTITDATYQDRRVIIDEHGVRFDGDQHDAPAGTSQVEDSLNDELAEEGFEVRLIPGSRAGGTNEARASSGALVVRMVRSGAPEEFGDSDRTCKDMAELQPEPVGEVEEEVAENPAYEDRPPYNQTPEDVFVSEAIPPAIPCPLLLFERSVDVGVALGGASAQARYLPLPPIPTFRFPNDVDFGDDFDFGSDAPPVAIGGVQPPVGGGSALPSYGEVPPVPIESFGVADLGPDVAGKVKAAYAVMALLLGATLIGRRVFRFLVLP